MNESKPEYDRLPVPGKRPNPVRRRVWMQVLLSLVIFSSGAIVGTCTTLVLIRQRIHHRIRHPEEMPHQIASHLKWKLDLSDKQTQQVEAVLTDRQQAIQQIRREFQPQLERELDQLEEQVAELLDDSQRTMWQTCFQKMRVEWIPAVPQSEKAISREK